MSLLSDSIALYKREMEIFRANLRVNIVRSAIFPLFIILIFGSIGGTVTNIPVVVVNYANNAQSSQFISTLGIQSLMSVQTVTDENDALAMLAAGKVNFAIIILPNFPSYNGKPAIEVYYNNLQYTVTEEVLPVIQERAAQFSSPASYQEQFYSPSGSSSLSVSTPVSGASGSYQDFLFSGVLGMVLVFSALFGGGISIISDKTAGNIKSFLVAPINKSAILIGRIFSGMVQSLLYITVVLIIGTLDGSTIAMGVLGLFWIFFLGMLLMISFTSIAAIIAGRLKNVQAYAIFSQAVGLPLWFLAGGIFPVSSLPPLLQTVSLLDPMTYALDGFRYVVLQGTYPLANIIIDVSALCIFALATTMLSIALFKSTID